MESAFGGEIQEATHHGDASSGATVLRQYCDTANLTGGFQASCANRVTFCGSRGFENENVRDDGVELVPFVVVHRGEGLEVHLISRRGGPPVRLVPEYARPRGPARTLDR